MTSARRAAALARFGSSELDLLVVGGGATGAAVARDAAVRGLSVGLCEAGDFAGQTSSRSSKLIHGGLRYLQYGDFHLVFEGLRERGYLLRTAPHLCRPIEFLFPAYRGERPGLGTLSTGIRLYDALALWRAPARHRRVPAHELYRLAPHLRAAGLEGAEMYVDCQTDDARLVLANVLDAEEAGAAVANHLRADRFRRDRRGRVRGIELVDEETDARIEARARLVVSATGPFTDGFLAGQPGDEASRPKLRPTLGVHLVFDAERVPHGDRALVLRSPRDNRLFFVLPAGRRTIVGTTDTDWAPDPAGAAGRGPRPPLLGDVIRARGEDVRYLLESVNHAFPDLRADHDDVVSTFAALRPLLATSALGPSETSREHEIGRTADGVMFVAGGKLTTARRMGEEVVDQAVEALRAGGLERAVGRSATATRPLPGAGPTPPDQHELAADVRERLHQAYGSRAGQLLALISDRAELGRRIDPELPYVWAEVVHAVRHEHALQLDDVLARRVPIFRDARDQGLAAAERVAGIIAEERGWTREGRERALARYRDVVALARLWENELS